MHNLLTTQYPDQFPPMVLYIAAHLIHANFTRDFIKKVVVFKDTLDIYWVHLYYLMPTGRLHGNQGTSYCLYHFTSPAGFQGIHSNLSNHLGHIDHTPPLQNKPPFPLYHPIILASPGYYNHSTNTKYQAFFSFGHQNSEAYNTSERATIFKKAKESSKNIFQACIYMETPTVKSMNMEGMASYKAQTKITTEDYQAITLGKHKIAFHQKHTLPTGCVFKLFQTPPSNWSKQSPLFLA